MTAIVTEFDLKRSRTHATVALLVLQAYDLWITFKVLSLGGTELNPAAKLLIGMGLIIPLKLIIPFIALWKMRHSKPSRFKWNNLPELPAVCVSWFVTGIYSLVVVLNTITYFTYV